MGFSALLSLLALEREQIVDYREFLGQSPSVQIFGAGRSGICAKKLIESAGGRVLQFIDNDVAKQGTVLEEIPVTAIGGLLPGFKVVIASSWGKEIAIQLRKNNVDDYIDLSFAFDRMYESHFDISVLESTSERLTDLYESLEDMASRRCLLGLVRYRLTLDPAFLEPSSYPQYFSPRVHVRQGDTIVDGGAWTGDTVSSFLHAAKNRCRVIAFEPVSGNYSVLIGEHATHIENGILVAVPKGLWDKKAELRIASPTENSGRSRIQELGSTVNSF